MNARIALGLAAFASLATLAGCATSTTAAAVPHPVVGYALPAPDARTTFPGRFDDPAYQVRMVYATSNRFGTDHR